MWGGGGGWGNLRDPRAEGAGRAPCAKPSAAGWTPLGYAAFLGHDNVLNLLLETAKAGVDTPSKGGLVRRHRPPSPIGGSLRLQTPLMLASGNNYESTA